MTGEIEYRYEEARTGHRGMPLYIFAVSIQNHIYDLDQRKSDEKDPENSIKVSIDLPEVDEESRKKLEKYFNGIALTNDALAELTDYFAGCGEDTVIVFFGDHAPGIAKLGTDIYKEGKNTGHRTLSGQIMPMIITAPEISTCLTCRRSFLTGSICRIQCLRERTDI